MADCFKIFNCREIAARSVELHLELVVASYVCGCGTQCMSQICGFKIIINSVVV